MIASVPRVWVFANGIALFASFSLVASSAHAQDDPAAPAPAASTQPPAPTASAPSGPTAPPVAPVTPTPQPTPPPTPPPTPQPPYPQTAPAYPTWPPQAQPYPGPSWPSQVSLDLITKTPGAGFEVYQENSKPGRDAPIATCPSTCRLFLYPGTYRIRITETDETLSGSRVIDVSQSMAIDFDPDTSAKKNTGLVLGITGPIMMLAGVATLLGHPQDSKEDNETRMQVGGFLLLGGLAATPIGWVMFGTSFKPEYEIRTWKAGPSPSWSMGPGVTGSGVGWVGSGSF